MKDWADDWDPVAVGHVKAWEKRVCGMSLKRLMLEGKASPPQHLFQCVGPDVLRLLLEQYPQLKSSTSKGLLFSLLGDPLALSKLQVFMDHHMITPDMVTETGISFCFFFLLLFYILFYFYYLFSTNIFIYLHNVDDQGRTLQDHLFQEGHTKLQVRH